MSGSPPPAGRPLRVAVVGPGDADPADAALAEEVGRLLAEAGAVVVCGGLGGVMAAASRGAALAGGFALGLLPGTDPAAANPWVTVAVATGLGELRNGLVVANADAVVAVGTGYGTLSEIALAARAGRVVVGLGTFELGLPGGGRDGAVTPASGPGDAVARALAAARAATGVTREDRGAPG